MATRAEKTKLGIFLTVAAVLLTATLAVLTGSEFWEERWSYTVNFSESVSGLEPGAPVKQRGVRVGYVDQIRVSPDSVERVRVRIKVNPGTPIKADTVAYMNMQGITGLKFVELKGGTEAAERLPPGNEIEAGTSTLQELTGRATDISLKVEKLLNNLLVVTRDENQQRIDNILETGEEAVIGVEKAAGEVYDLSAATEKAIEENKGPLYSSIKTVGRMSNKAIDTLTRIDGLADQLGSIASSSQIPQAVAEIRSTNQAVQTKIKAIDVDKAIAEFVVAVQRLQRLLSEASETISQNQDSLRVTFYNLRTISENLKELSRTFQEKPYIQVFGSSPKERKTPDE